MRKNVENPSNLQVKDINSSTTSHLGKGHIL